MFCLGATVGRRIGDPYLMRHLAAKSADLMFLILPIELGHEINFCLIYFLRDFINKPTYYLNVS
jgi:hypothetical protein